MIPIESIEFISLLDNQNIVFAYQDLVWDLYIRGVSRKKLPHALSETIGCVVSNSLNANYDIITSPNPLPDYGIDEFVTNTIGPSFAAFELIDTLRTKSTADAVLFITLLDKSVYGVEYQDKKPWELGAGGFSIDRGIHTETVAALYGFVLIDSHSGKLLASSPGWLPTGGDDSPASLDFPVIKRWSYFGKIGSEFLYPMHPADLTDQHVDSIADELSTIMATSVPFTLKQMGLKVINSPYTHHSSAVGTCR